MTIVIVSKILASETLGSDTGGLSPVVPFFFRTG